MNAHIDISNVLLTTPRLILRPWKETDLEDFYATPASMGLDRWRDGYLTGTWMNPG